MKGGPRDRVILHLRVKQEENTSLKRYVRVEVTLKSEIQRYLFHERSVTSRSFRTDLLSSWLHHLVIKRHHPRRPTENRAPLEIRWLRLGGKCKCGLLICLGSASPGVCFCFETNGAASIVPGLMHYYGNKSAIYGTIHFTMTPLERTAGEEGEKL